MNGYNQLCNLFWNSIGYVGGEGGNYYLFILRIDVKLTLAIYEAGSLGYLYTGVKAHL